MKQFTSSNPYILNNTRVYKYNEDYYKLIHFKNPVRQKGWEKVTEEVKKETNENQKHINDIINTKRARRKIRDYALCNDWDYFITLTIDRKKYDASDLNTLTKEIKRKLKTYKQSNKDFQYLIIPELHEDKKNFHFHGLMRGIKKSHIIEHRKLKQRMRYNWTYWEKHFGFTSFIELDNNKTRVANYITKYMTKDIITVFNKDRYFVSRGLKTPELLLSVCDANTTIDYDFTNEYCDIKEYTDYDHLIIDIIPF